MRHTLLSRVRHVLPDLAWTSEGGVWAGCRPMAPDSLPLVGALPSLGTLSPAPPVNVYVNCGHGANGWTMCCGTASLLAGIIASRHHSPVQFWESDGTTSSFELAEACSPSRFRITTAVSSALVAAGWL